MTTTTWCPDTLTSVTLSERQWGAIRTAVLCLSCDCSTAGKDDDAAYYLKAYKALKEALEA